MLLLSLVMLVSAQDASAQPDAAAAARPKRICRAAEVPSEANPCKPRKAKRKPSRTSDGDIPIQTREEPLIEIPVPMGSVDSRARHR